MQGSARIDELRQKFHENPRRYFAPLANEYRKAGDPEQAIAICRAHLAQQPGHMSGHVVYGQALYDAKRIDEARTVFEKALSLDPDNAIVLRHLGDIARQRGETAEAKHWYGRALDADPNNSEIAAYIAELTEPLTESAEPVVARAAEPVTAGSAEPVAGIGEAVAVSVSDSAPAAHEAVPPEAGATEATEAAAEDAPDAIELVDASAADATVSEAVEEASAAPSEVEVSETPSLAETSEQPADAAPASERGEQARRETPVATPIVPLADVAWRKTPPHEDSPFVTRTMAELYAKQGYRAAALDVYRQLSLINPDDQEILSRIRELSADEGVPREADAEVVSSPAVEPTDDEAAAREEPEPASIDDVVAGDSEAESSAQTEPVGAAAIPAVDESHAVPGRVEELAAAAPPDWTEVNEEPVYTPAVEEIEPEPKPSSQSTEGRHFTEVDLAAGDTWDTDTWGAGFSADESTDIELDIPDTPIVHLSQEPDTASKDAAPTSEPVTPVTEPAADALAPEPTGTAAPPAEEAIVAEERGTSIPETAPSIADEEPASDPAAVADEPLVAPRSANEDFVEAERFVAAEEESLAEVENGASDAVAPPIPPTIAPPAREAESEAEADAEPDRDDEPHLVAYSPTPPDDEDLPHYEPKGPTVREFFATLGARRPPTGESAQSFTARAAVPSLENPSDYPLAASAFADLFPDSPIAEEDTRAAFALSGAMSGTPAGAENPSAAETKRNTPPSPAPPVDNNQESEEDIRRFREWLDGLAES